MIDGRVATPTFTDRLIVMIPIFNDWDAVDLLLQDLEPTLDEHHIAADVLIINDGSTMTPPQHLPRTPTRAIRQVEIVNLRRNLGHQRAIAIGLAFVHAHRPCDAVLIMDGDGEDRPTDVPLLLERWHRTEGTRIVFAERTKRSESVLFKVFYTLYRGVHHALTGIRVRVGSFSVVPPRR